MSRTKRMRRRLRVPTVLQMEATECGAASLAMVLAYHGLHIPLEQLRVDCGVSRDGSSARNMLVAARHYGCKATEMHLEIDQLHTAHLPLILFWEFKHFVVLEGRKGNTFYLNDPACGPRRVSLAEMNTSYTGVALQIQPGSRFQRGGRPRPLLAGIYQRAASMKGALFLSC